MVDSAFYHELLVMMPGRVRAGELMKKYTSWRIGGPSEIFVEPAGREDLRSVVAYAHSRGLPLTVIGAGTNILVSDQGIKGIVVKLGRGLDAVTTGQDGIAAEAGAKLARIAAAAWQAGLGGFEFSAGIPGVVGGALAMNAGANGSSIGDLVREVGLLSLEGEFFYRSREEMSFGYRTSILQQEPSIVVSASFACRRRDKSEIQKEMEQFLKRRKTTQPLHYPSAGSIFKNPPGDSAGRLIEAVGLKGLRIGDAQVSELHANFIINLGAASARDVLALISKIREKVLGYCGVELKLEVKIIGDI